ncbi:MAG: ATP-binding cassette domain-containing protein [bacterium]
MIKLENVHKAFGSSVILKKINLHVGENESVVVCGPGGSGKTTLLKLCQGLVKPDSGRVLIDNRDIGKIPDTELMEMRKNIGMLFQYYALFDSMTVAQNVGFYLANHTDLTPEEIEHRVRDNLKLVRLEESYDLMPSELSGGMQKRVGIARALTHRPSIILYDSPTDGLDPVTADAIVDMILSINKQFGITSLIVSNDMNTIFRLGNRIAFLYNGNIHAIGTPDDIIHSEDPYVYQFIRGLGQGPLYE